MYYWQRFLRCKVIALVLILFVFQFVQASQNNLPSDHGFYPLSNSGINSVLAKDCQNALQSEPVPPGITTGTGGVFHCSFYQYESNTEVHLMVYDYNGISNDGSSHDVVMNTPTMSQHNLRFGHKISNVQAMYRLWLDGQKPADGDYTFTVTDEDGLSASVVDRQITRDIPSVDISQVSFIPNGTSPTITWVPLPDAVFYQVNIRDESNTFNWWSGSIPEAQVTIPPGVLDGSSEYVLRIISHFEDGAINMQNISYSDDYFFSTKNVTKDPFIAFHESYYNPVLYGSEEHGRFLSFNVTIYDVGGVPDNIESVEVVFPDAQTREKLYYRRNNAGGGLYGVLALPRTPVQGTYTFLVRNKDGRTYQRSKELIPNSLSEPNWMQATPEDGTVISGNSITIDWPDVSGASSYHLQILDIFYNYVFGKWVDQSSHSLTRGILQEGKTYYYRVTAQREGSVYQNYMGMVESAQKRFFLSPRYGGSSPPEIKNSWVGFLTTHVGESELEFLEISATISDLDGLQNMHTVRVQAPNEEEYLLNKMDVHDDNTARYWTLLIQDQLPSSGTYHFTAKDFNNNTTQVSRDHIVDPLNYLPADDLNPRHNQQVSLPLILTWPSVPNAARYQVDIYDGLGRNFIKRYADLSRPGLTIPAGDLESGKSYRYRVYAWDENYDNFTIPQLFWTLCPAFHVRDSNVVPGVYMLLLNEDTAGN